MENPHPTAATGLVSPFQAPQGASTVRGMNINSPEGATEGAAPVAVKGEGKPRSRNEQRHAENVKLKAEYVAVEKKMTGTTDPKEREKLQDELSRIGGEFVAANSGLAGNMVRVFNPHKLNSEDYEGYAFQGLWEAFTKWDPERGTFSTFSRPFLSGRLQRAVRRWEHSHLTQQEWSDRALAARVRNRLVTELGREPTPQEIAEKTGYDPKSVERMFNSPVRSLEDRSDISEDRDSNLEDETLPDVADIVGEGDDIELLLPDLNPLELMAAIFANESLSVTPRKLAHVAQATGLGRNQLGKAAISGTARLARSILRKHLGTDPDPSQIVEAMGLEGRERTVADSLRRSMEPRELRSAHSRNVRKLAEVRREGSPAATVRAAEAQVSASEERIFAFLASIVNELTNGNEQRDPQGWSPADPEPIADAAWSVFIDSSRWPETGTRAAFLRAVKSSLPGRLRPEAEGSSSDPVEVDGGWVRRRTVR